MPPGSQDPLTDYLRAVIAALPSSAPPYCLIGALAVNAWGRLRATKDIDLMVLADPEPRTQLVNDLQAKGFEIDHTWLDRNPLAKDVVLRLTHTSYPGFPLDLLFATDPQSQSTLARRRPLHLLDISLWVCSPEDLILLKLKASRPHDFEDALGIVSNPHLELEFDYLWKWADRLGLQGELHYVLKAAGR